MSTTTTTTVVTTKRKRGVTPLIGGKPRPASKFYSNRWDINGYGRGVSYIAQPYRQCK